MLVDVHHGCGNDFLVDRPHRIPPAGDYAGHVMLAQHGINPDQVAVDHRVPREVLFLFNAPDLQQHFPDPRMRFRSVMQVEHPVKQSRQPFQVPQGHQHIRLKQEQQPAAVLPHSQGMDRLMGNHQHLVLPDRVRYAVYHIVHTAFQGQHDFHRGMNMLFKPPGLICIPDANRRIVRVGHVFALSLQYPETVFVPFFPDYGICPALFRHGSFLSGRFFPGNQLCLFYHTLLSRQTPTELHQSRSLFAEPEDAIARPSPIPRKPKISITDRQVTANRQNFSQAVRFVTSR